MSNGRREGLLNTPTLAVAAILFAGGALLGIFAPGQVVPHPLVLLPVALIFMDTALSAVVAARDQKPFNGVTHFAYLVLFVAILYAICAMSDLRQEIVVLVPLVIRETFVLSKLF
jgi:peptidoglycan/LPS O-acetylase OafA/YrhL